MTDKRKEFLVFGSPRIEQPEIDEVVASLKSGWIGTGPKVARFQEMMAAYTGAKHAKALNSCTAGLHLALLAVGVKPGDEVVTTPMTFAASANVIVHAGATPVFADVEKASMNLDPAELDRAITPRTKAVIAVDMAGRPCNLDAILKVARRHGVPVIEDAAHSLGATYHGQRVGNIADITAFSFYVTKNIVTAEGGMVTTNDDAWAETIEVMGLHGLSAGAWKRYQEKGFKHYEVVAPGYKYNMTDLQASLGIHQLPRIEAYQARREAIWKRYDEAFADLPVTLPAPPEPGTTHARHLYTLLLDLERLDATRDQVIAALREENIGAGIHFVALHLHKYYRETYGLQPMDFPNAKAISDRTLSLPLSAKLTDDDVEDVVGAVRRVILARARAARRPV